MKLTNPFFISSRLLPALKVGDAVLQVNYSRLPGRDSRTRYEWTLDIGDKSFNANDLQSGNGGGDLTEGFISFLSFLSACGESYAYRGLEGENADLFPLEVAQWAAENQDEIALVRFEVGENQTLIAE